MERRSTIQRAPEGSHWYRIFRTLPLRLRRPTTIVYLIHHLVSILCNLESAYYCCQVFFDRRFACAQQAVEDRSKPPNIRFELFFIISGITTFMITDLRAQQDLQSNTSLSFWSALRIVGSSLMLVCSKSGLAVPHRLGGLWPRCQHSCCLGKPQILARHRDIIGRRPRSLCGTFRPL